MGGACRSHGGDVKCVQNFGSCRGGESLRTAATSSFPDIEHGEPRWNDIDRGKPEELGGRSVPVPLCPQISRGLTQARTWAYAVRGRRLTAMERPNFGWNK
jgi:hypothetical protein